MFKISVQGINGVKAQFLSASKDLAGIVDQEMESMAKQWVLQAKRDAPKDLGGAGLEGTINFSKLKPLSFQIFALKVYAPFMEFGTKGNYRSIPGTEAIAAQFKGFRGSGGDFFKAIKIWVKRKGIGASVTSGGRPSKSRNSLAAQELAAFLIAMSILRNGVRPHPFFFKQQEIVWPQMIRRVKQRIEKDSKVIVIEEGQIFRPKIITI